MDFYFEVNSWKEIPLNKTFALTEATSYTAAVDKFEKKEGLLPSFIVKEASSPRYWMPADISEWTPEEMTEFSLVLRRVDR